MIGMWKLAPALACGCTIVMKPAELTSLSALRIAELALEAGLPPRRVQCRHGPGPRRRRRAGQSSRRRQGDLHRLARRGARHHEGRGQPTSSASRSSSAASRPTSSLTMPISSGRQALRLPASSSMRARCARRAPAFWCRRRSTTRSSNGWPRARKSLRMGDPPRSGKTVLGPVISEKQMKVDPRLCRHRPEGRRDARSPAARRVGERGYFISPAVFANVAHEMRISQEEIFGPVVSVIKFKDEADALRIANGTAYSLAAGRLEPRYRQAASASPSGRAPARSG